MLTMVKIVIIQYKFLYKENHKNSKKEKSDVKIKCYLKNLLEVHFETHINVRSSYRHIFGFCTMWQPLLKWWHNIWGSLKPLKPKKNAICGDMYVSLHLQYCRYHIGDMECTFLSSTSTLSRNFCIFCKLILS